MHWTDGKFVNPQLNITKLKHDKQRKYLQNNSAFDSFVDSTELRFNSIDLFVVFTAGF